MKGKIYHITLAVTLILASAASAHVTRYTVTALGSLAEYPVRIWADSHEGYVFGAWGISNSGMVVGILDDGYSSNWFVWDSENGMRLPKQLPEMPDYKTVGGRPIAMNNAGQVIGQTGKYDTYHGFIWDAVNGETNLGLYADLVDINESGQVLVRDRSGGSEYYIWDPINGRVDLVLDPHYTFAYNMELIGWVGSDRKTNVWGQKISAGYLYEASGSRIDLNDYLVDAPIGYHEGHSSDLWIQATAINDAGQITAVGSYGFPVPNGYPGQEIGTAGQPYLLTPIPEPTTLMAVLWGLGIWRIRVRTKCAHRT